MREGFRAGVDRGGLTTEFEVKLLILYLLKDCQEPIPLSYILNAVMKTGSANYFEVIQSACKLMETGHITVVDGERGKCYAITRQGTEAYDEFDHKLPFTVRTKVLEELHLEQKRHKQEGSAKVRTEKIAGGYRMTLSIRDVHFEMLSTSIFLPTLELCQQIEHRFLDDPVVFYKGVVALLTGNAHHLGRLLN